MNITYILNQNSNSISCLSDNKLSMYILTKDEQNYIDNLTNDTMTLISTLQLSASIKAGSSLYTQPVLNSLYARHDDPTLKDTDRVDLKEFLNSRLVGNNIINFEELK